MITTKNVLAFGLYNRHEGIGILDVDVQDLDISTESTGIYRNIGTLSYGIYGQHDSVGDIDIDVRSGSIETKGTYSYGIYGLHQGDGGIEIDTNDGHTITTTGDNAQGIVAYHLGTEDSRTITITVGGSVNASGAAVGDLVQIDRLIFLRAPQPLDEDVVPAPAPAVHRDPDAGRLQAPGEGEAGELAALVGVEDLGRAMPDQGFVETLGALREHLAKPLDRLALPGAHLVRVNLVLRGDLLKRPLAPKRLKRHLRLHLPRKPASLDAHPHSSVGRWNTP